MERNAADLTLKSYREDLTGLLEYLEVASLEQAAPQDLQVSDLRAYLAAKLLWDPHADVKRHMREFLQGFV